VYQPAGVPIGQQHTQDGVNTPLCILPGATPDYLSHPGDKPLLQEQGEELLPTAAVIQPQRGRIITQQDTGDEIIP